MTPLIEWGLSPFFESQVGADVRAQLRLGRVIEEQKNSCFVITEQGELLAEVSGKLRHEAQSRADFPAVGDWVLVAPRPGGDELVPRGTIHRVLERRTKLSRRAAGSETAEQIVAANVDTVFIVTSLNGDLNPRRIERYLALAWDAGAVPVILLTKADLAPGTDAVAEVERVAPYVSVHAVSALTGQGISALAPYVGPGRTSCLVGSSGVGKSTLLNRLAGIEVQRTHAIRESDARGRHTTTARELFRLPGGGLLIDTPGMRELQFWEGEEGLSLTFDDVERFAGGCRFTDCGHRTEPGCGVLAALASGDLEPERLESYRKLERELRFEERKRSKRLMSEEKKRWRQIHLENRRRDRFRPA